MNRLTTEPNVVFTHRVNVMHVVDSLDAGGAERVAVNLVNALPRDRFTVHLCTTRRDGSLDAEVATDVGRLRLARRGRWDVRAVRRMVSYVHEHRIEIIHAHNTSLFISAAIGLLPWAPIVIWHDHFGRYMVEERSRILFGFAARRAAGVIAVNAALAEWSRTRLGVPADRVWQIPNFVRSPGVRMPTPELPGRRENRIVCVANLRPEKDHLTLLDAMSRVVRERPNAHLLLVGGSRMPQHALAVHSRVAQLGLARNVTLLGERNDVPAILGACAIGVLSSASEGFPLALLEYGMAGLPAVATRVGQCGDMLDEGRFGILVTPRAADELASAILGLLEMPTQRAALGAAFRQRVIEEFGESGVIARIGSIYDTLLGCR